MTDKCFMDIKILKDTRRNLVEVFFENVIQDIISKILEDKDGEYRCLYYGDKNEFYNANPEVYGIKIQRLTCETYSIPLTRCSYNVLYDLFNAVINDAIETRKYKYTGTPLVICDICKVNGTNLEIGLGIGLREK